MPKNEILLQDWLRSQLKTDTAISELSRETGIARTTIYRILNGKGDPAAGTIERIANALGVPVPKVEKVFVVNGDTEQSVLSLIASAQEQLNRAVKKLERLEKSPSVQERDQGKPGKAKRGKGSLDQMP